MVTNPVSFKADIGPCLNKSCALPRRHENLRLQSRLRLDHGRLGQRFCKQTPGPLRYTVVIAMLECQKAALAAWLAEPKVLQVQRADDTSPVEAYLMPPFN